MRCSRQWAARRGSTARSTLPARRPGEVRVEMIGASSAAIDKAEDPEKFKQAMARSGFAARVTLAHSLEEALQVQAAIGFPA